MEKKLRGEEVGEFFCGELLICFKKLPKIFYCF